MTVFDNVAFGLRVRRCWQPAATRRDQAPRRRAARSRAARRACADAIRRSSRAASASASRSRARSRSSRKCCCSTSRSARSTRACAASCAAGCAACTTHPRDQRLRHARSGRSVRARRSHRRHEPWTHRADRRCADALHAAGEPVRVPVPRRGQRAADRAARGMDRRATMPTRSRSCARTISIFVPAPERMRRRTSKPCATSARRCASKCAIRRCPRR